MESLNEKLRTTSFDVQFDNQRIETFEVYTKYNITCALGQGAFGCVVEAEDTSIEPDENGSRSVAIKKLPLIFNHPHHTKSALREICILQQFSHPNILGVRDIIVPLMEKDGKVTIDLDLADVYVVLDKMDYDLSQVMQMSARGEIGMDIQQRRFFLYQILRGLKCIHSANVLHRDLKPSNILVNAACEIKICDFGMARGSNAFMTTNVCTQWYRAPELLLVAGGEEAEFDHAAEYDQAVDIWSVGCIMAELMLLRPIFAGKPSPPKQLEAIFEVLGGPPPEVENTWQGQQWQARPWREVLSSSEFEETEIDLCSKMLQFDPKKRVTVLEALEHPHLEEWHDPDDEPICEKGEFVFAFEESDAERELLKQFAKFHPEVGAHIKSLAVDAAKPDAAGE